MGYAVPAVLIAIIWNDFWGLIIPLLGIALALNLLLAVWVAAKACFMISDARASGALDLLLTTPLSPRAIVDGHGEALRRQFFLPFMVLTISEIIIASALETRTEGTGLSVVLTGVAAAFLGAQLVAVGWFGLWTGLTTKKPAHAVVKTILWVMVLPLAPLAFCGCLFPIVYVVKDAIFIRYASSRLHKHLRAIVTEGLPAKAVPRPRLIPARKDQ